MADINCPKPLFLTETETMARAPRNEELLMIDMDQHSNYHASIDRFFRDDETPRVQKLEAGASILEDIRYNSQHLGPQTGSTTSLRVELNSKYFPIGVHEQSITHQKLRTDQLQCLAAFHHRQRPLVVCLLSSRPDHRAGNSLGQAASRVHILPIISRRICCP